MRYEMQNRSREKSGFWVPLLAALALHALILLIPMVGKTPSKDRVPAQIELQLTTFHTPSPVTQELQQVPEKSIEEPVTEPDPLPVPDTVMPDHVAENRIKPTPPVLIPAPPVRELNPNFQTMTQDQKSRLTSAILMHQFIREESQADIIFGKPLRPGATEIQPGFHHPVQPNMITMLDQPMQELPFAYTPGLVHFAYEPGVKGDLQRFWDVITPEFGWRTNNGTEFKCVMVLIIVGCGWK